MSTEEANYRITVRPTSDGIITRELEDKILERLDESRNNFAYRKTDKELYVVKEECIWDYWEEIVYDIECDLNVRIHVDVDYLGDFDEEEDEDW